MDAAAAAAADGIDLEDPEELALQFQARVNNAVAVALANHNLPPPPPHPVPVNPPAPVAAIGVHLSTFWTSDPDMWFYRAECSFTKARITRSATKFEHVVPMLPEDVMSSIRQFLIGITPDTENPYEQLKDALCKGFGRTRWQRGYALLDHPELGDRRPSHMLNQMLALLPAGTEPDLLFFCLFLRRLPMSMREQVAAANHKTAEQMGEHADALWDARADRSIAAITDSISAVSVRPRSTSPKGDRRRSPGRSSDTETRSNGPRSNRRRGDSKRRRYDPDLCFYHNRWGHKAEKCESPCSWPKN
jgi:hypothetical protein